MPAGSFGHFGPAATGGAALVGGAAFVGGALGATGCWHALAIATTPSSALKRTEGTTRLPAA